MQIQGWGGYQKIEATVNTPQSQSACQKEVINQTLIARGMGRSYGDSAIAEKVLQTTYLDHLIAFDNEKGLIKVQSGVTIRELLKFIVPKGWFIAVTPGTSFVTVGGAIASDVHGKNHHINGTFCQHVKFMTVLLGTGEMVTTSALELPDLFHATCGGMGLTGVILTATLILMPIKSAHIKCIAIRTRCIDETFEQFEVNKISNYSVAWIDCLARGKQLGRSVLMLGEHIDSGSLVLEEEDPITIPIYTPATVLNKLTMKLFNESYYATARKNKIRVVSLTQYFHPLDRVGGWNKLYGKNGFVQFQSVVPRDGGVDIMRKLLIKISESGTGSFLAVLKKLGEQNDNFLSFPIDGYTLALDFKMSNDVVKLLSELEEMVVGVGGRIYLAKDSLMSERSFKTSYPNWRKFETVREKYGATGKFASSQSKRLGLL